MASPYDPSQVIGGLPTLDQSTAQALAQMGSGMPSAPQNGVITGGLKAGGAELLSGLGGMYRAAGSALGMPGLAARGQAGQEYYRQMAQRVGRPDLEGNFTSIPGLGYNVAKMVPGLAAAMLGGGAGGAAVRGLGLAGEAVAGAAAPTAVRVGQTLGAGLSMYPGAVGGNVEAATEGGRELTPGTSAKALALGVPEAAVMSYLPGSLVSSMEKATVGGIGKRLLMGAGYNAPIGAVQAAATTAMTQTMGDPNKSVADRAHEIVNSAMAGGILGGVVGAGVHGVFGHPEMKIDPTINTDALKETVDQQLALPAPPKQLTYQPTFNPETDVRYVNRAGEVTAGLYPPEPPKPFPTTTDETGQITIPELQGEPVRGEQPEPAPAQVQMPSFWTTEEMGARSPQIIAMRNQLREAAGPNMAAPLKDFVDNLQATSDPEVVKALRERITQYDADGKDIPVTIQKLAESYGVMKDGKEFDPAQAQQELQAKIDMARQKTDEGYAAQMDRVRELGVDTSAGKTWFDKATQAKEIAEKKISDMQANSAELQKLVELHAQADALPDKFAPVEVPGHVAERGQSDMWQQASLLVKSGDPDTVKYAQRALDFMSASRTNRVVAPLIQRAADAYRSKVSSHVDEHPDLAMNENIARDTSEAAPQEQPVADPTQEAQILGSTMQPHEEQVAAASVRPSARAQVFVEDNLQPKMSKADQRAADNAEFARQVEMQQAEIRQYAAKTQAEDAFRRAHDQQARLQEINKPANPAAAVAANAPAIVKTPPITKPKDFMAWRARQRDILRGVPDPANATQMDHDLAHIISEGGNAQNVLNYLHQNGEDEFTRALAGQMLRKGLKTTIGFDTPEMMLERAQRTMPGEQADLEGAYGFFDRQNDHASFLGMDQAQSNVMHELVHATTHRAIDENGPIAKRLEGLRKVAVEAFEAKGLGDRYGFKNTHEFVAEAFSNKAFQKELADIKSPRQKWNLWETFKDVISKMLNQPARFRSLLDDVIEHGMNAMDETQRIGSVPDVHEQVNLFGRRADDVLSMAQRALEDRGVGSVNLKHTIRDKIIGWSTMTNLRDIFKKYFVKPEGGDHLSDAVQARHDRDTINARINQKSLTARRSVEQIAAQKPAVRDLIQKLMGYTSYDIDPRRGWEDHSWLHSDKDAPELRKMVAEAQKDYSKIRQLGGADAYHQLISSNKADVLATIASLVHEFGHYEFATSHLPEFEQHPAEAFQRDGTSVHDKPIEAEAYWRNVVKSQLDALTKARNELTSKAGEGAEGLDSLDELKADMSKWIEKIDQAPYFHQGRHGNFFVSGHLPMKDGKIDAEKASAFQKFLIDNKFDRYAINTLGDRSTVFMRVENADQAARLRALFEEAQKAKVLDPDKQIAAGLPGTDDVVKGVAPRYLKRIMERASNSQAFKMPEGADNETAAALSAAQATIMREMRGQYMDALPQMSEKRVMAYRKNISGFDKDMLRNFSWRAQVAANNLSNLAAQHKLDKALMGMDSMVTEAKRGSDLNKALSMQQVVRELMTREAMRSWRVNTGIIDHIRAWNHAFYLGASIPYMLEQMSQVPMLLLPELGKRYGFVNSAKAIASVTGTAFKVMRVLASSDHKWDAVITPQILRDAGMSKAQTDMIMGVVNRGGIDLNSFTREMGEAAKGGSVSAETKWLQRANATAIYSEVFSRMLSVLAADKLYKGLDSGRAAYIDDVLSQSMMDWGSWNTSRQTSKYGFAGKMTPLMMSFTGYQTRIIEKLYREVSTAFMDREATPEGKAEARKFLAGHLAATTVIAGTLGMPFATAIAGAASNMANFLTGKDDFDIEASYREFLADVFGKDFAKVVAKGVPAGALGFDTSELGDQNLAPFNKLLSDRRKLEESAPDWAKTALGSPFGIGLNWFEGMRDFAYGLPLQGFAKMVPHGLKGPTDAWRMSQFGYEDEHGRKLPIDASQADILMRAVGLNPSDKAEYDEKARTAQALKEARAERSGFLKQRLEIAASHEDPEALQAAMQASQQYGMDHPMHQILPKLGQFISQDRIKSAQAKAMGGMPLGIGLSEMEIAKRLGSY